MPRRGLLGAAAAAWLVWWRLVAAAAAWALRGLPRLWRGLARAGGAEQREPWQCSADHRVYRGREPDPQLLTVRTASHAFQVALGRLAEESAYFQALARSGMQEAVARQLELPHVSSGAFRAILEFVFTGHFAVGEEELLPAVQAASYLQVPAFLARCWPALNAHLNPHNCLALLRFAEAIGCPEMRAELCHFLSTELLELAPITAGLASVLRDELTQLRERGPLQLCLLRKENLGIQPGPEMQALRGLYRFPLGRAGTWHRASTLPFQAEKWSFSAAQLLNYLFLIGGYREPRGARGFTFRMAAFRYNPLANRWQPTAPLLKRRRHFSTAVSGQHIYAIGGWYLDSLLAPDVSTALYAAVERYDPWHDTWAFVSSLPLTDITFAISLSHDVPLCTGQADCLYALGTVRRTGEKLLLRYDIRADTWQELLPTLTRADTDLPGLYFLGGAEPLYVLGGNARENVLTSFSPEARRWGPARSLPRCALAGQGAAQGTCLFMAAPDLGAVLRVELDTLACCPLPPPPLPLSYEAVVLLHFPPAAPDAGSEQGRRARTP